jgi:palmitoyltransferase
MKVRMTENNEVDRIKMSMKKYHFTENPDVKNNARRSYNMIEINSNDHSFRSRKTNAVVDIVNKDNTIDKKDATASELIDSRFCLDCMIDIPLRAKHCYTCNRCITTFDHHCFWIGNCIGERNKKIFIIFLIIHSVEIGFIIIVVSYL